MMRCVSFFFPQGNYYDFFLHDDPLKVVIEIHHEDRSNVVNH